MPLQDTDQDMPQGGAQLLIEASQLWERGSASLAQALARLSEDSLRLLREEERRPVRAVVPPHEARERFSLELPSAPQSLDQVMERVLAAIFNLSL